MLRGTRKCVVHQGEFLVFVKTQGRVDNNETIAFFFLVVVGIIQQCNAFHHLGKRLVVVVALIVVVVIRMRKRVPTTEGRGGEFEKALEFLYVDFL